MLGPVVAYIGGGFLLNYYTHFDTVDTSTSVSGYTRMLVRVAVGWME